MTSELDNQNMIQWGHTKDVDEYRKYIWKLMYEKWISFIGAIPQPSLDIGAAKSKTHSSVSLDPYPRGFVDVKGMGEELPFKDGSFKSVIIESVLKHVDEPSQVISEAKRVTTDNGMLFISSPVNRIDSHRHSFSSSALCEIIECNGYEIVRKLGIGFSKRSIDGFLWRRLPKAMANLPIPSGMASVIFIVAKARKSS
ncbi:MAG: methyltransferase domain-containing protein [Candidatus Thorarchaeota archaeon]|nr:methyltransferase domain-containing protein [Candidatus Thorarchaeota archaeon]